MPYVTLKIYHMDKNITAKTIKSDMETYGFDCVFGKKGYECDVEVEELQQEKSVAKESDLEWGETFIGNWHDGKKWGESDGDGWRMPTRNELKKAYEDNIGGFEATYYRSSSWYDYTSTWVVHLGNGGEYFDNENYNYPVRCVRERKIEEPKLETILEK